MPSELVLQNKSVGQNDELDSLIYLPNGEPNFPFIIANANLLLKGGEPKLAISLFLLTTQHKVYGFCGYYGMGQCYQSSQKYSHAVQAFEKAFTLGRRPYMGLAWIEALMAARDFEKAESVSLALAVEFANDPHVSERLRRFHEKSIALQNN